MKPSPQKLVSVQSKTALAPKGLRKLDAPERLDCARFCQSTPIRRPHAVVTRDAPAAPGAKQGDAPFPRQNHGRQKRSGEKEELRNKRCGTRVRETESYVPVLHRIAAQTAAGHMVNFKHVPSCHVSSNFYNNC